MLAPTASWEGRHDRHPHHRRTRAQRHHGPGAASRRRRGARSRERHGARRRRPPSPPRRGWSPRPTPWPPRRARASCAKAAARPTRWSRCRPCWGWSSRNRRVWAAGRSSSGTMPPPATMTTLDGRETAPDGRDARLLFQSDGERFGFFDAVVGGLSVGTPGTPDADGGGASPLGPCTTGATSSPTPSAMPKHGFAVSPRLASVVTGDAERLQTFDAAADYFFPDGIALLEGGTLRNQPYADTLRALAEEAGRRLLRRRDRRGHRGRRARQYRRDGQAGPAVDGRPGRLRGDRASGRLRALSRRRGLRHGAAVLRGADRRPDPRHAGPLRPGRAGPGLARMPGA